MKPPSFLLPAILWITAVPSGAIAAPPQIIDPKDKVVLEKFLEHTRNELEALTPEHFKAAREPEMLCWIEFRKLDMASTAYELTGEAKYLRMFAERFDNAREALVADSEGLLGWRGLPLEPQRHPAHPERLINEIQAEFRAVGVVSRFLELLDREPDVRKELGSKPAEYRDLLENHLVRKWDKCFVDLGENRAIYQWSPDFRPIQARLTLPYEKLAIIVEGLLNLHRATKNPAYAEKAAQLGERFKSHLTLKDGRYIWNYWDPSGEWDRHPDDPSRWKHWIGNEPKGQGHAATVGMVIQLHQHGLVFDKTDVSRFVATQMDICWNGSLDTPKFLTVRGTDPMEEEEMIAPALAPYEPRIAQYLYTGERQDERLEKSGSPWQGGIVAGEWLVGKYFTRQSAQETSHLLYESTHN